MKTIRVKICGIRRRDDLLMACDFGADAIGLVFYEKSPRAVSLEQAAELLQHIPPFVSTVGLFMNASASFVQTALTRLPLDLLQFHGNESAQFCDSFNHPYIKAIAMQSDDKSTKPDFAQSVKPYSQALAYLLDSHVDGKAGGTGKTFDWNQLPQHSDKPIILAGGLNPKNVATAIQKTQIYAVDVSSGVESQPGIKDKEKIRQFMQEVKRVG